MAAPVVRESEIMTTEYETLLEEALNEILGSNDLAAILAARVAILGKKGKITSKMIFKTPGSVAIITRWLSQWFVRSIVLVRSR